MSIHDSSFFEGTEVGIVSTSKQERQDLNKGLQVVPSDMFGNKYDYNSVLSNNMCGKPTHEKKSVADQFQKLY